MVYYSFSSMTPAKSLMRFNLALMPLTSLLSMLFSKVSDMIAISIFSIVILVIRHASRK